MSINVGKKKIKNIGASRLFANGEPLDGHVVPNESASVGERLNSVTLVKEFADIIGTCFTCKCQKSLIQLSCLHLFCSECLETMKLYFDQPYCFQCKTFIHTNSFG